MANAFGTAPHSLLKKCISKIADSRVSRYIRDELLNRTGFVVEKGEVSSEILLNAVGVPQGGCNSPTLFALLMTDSPILTKNKNWTSHVFFADDLAVTLARPTLETARADAIQMVKDVAEWASSRGLVVSFSKTTLKCFPLVLSH